jgi:hypothetical protein
MPRSSISDAIVRTAALNSREYRRYASKSSGNSTASGASAAAFINPIAECKPSARAS